MGDLRGKMVSAPNPINAPTEISSHKTVINLSFSPEYIECIVDKDPIPNSNDSPYLSIEYIHPPIVSESFDFSCKFNPCFFKSNIESVNMKLFYNQINGVRGSLMRIKLICNPE